MTGKQKGNEMPKQTIMSTSHEQPFRPSVGWTPGLDVQLGIQVWNSDLSVADVLHGGREGRHQTSAAEKGYREFELAKVGRALAKQMDEAGPIEWPQIDDQRYADLGQMVMDALREARSDIERDGVWTTLNRAAINDLIAALRKGRDSAYGRDQ